MHLILVAGQKHQFNKQICVNNSTTLGACLSCSACTNQWMHTSAHLSITVTYSASCFERKHWNDAHAQHKDQGHCVSLLVTAQLPPEILLVADQMRNKVRIWSSNTSAI